MKYAYWLYSIPGMTPAKCRRLYGQGIRAGELFFWPDEKILAIGGLKEKDRQAICQARQNMDPDRLFFSLQEKGIGFVSLEQSHYPEKLRSIADPPYGLFYLGSLPKEERMIAIVGARGRSEYGRQIARRLGCDLAKAGFGIVSGLALGIDADAHKGALDGRGRTWAVLGCGVDICYPGKNRYLYDQILLQGGGILSEYRPGQKPLAQLFPSRNRIISGLAERVVVVEARERSGSLITADFAADQGRDVWAVPGRVTDPLSQGCNQLIRQGAGILINSENFISELTDFQENSGIQMDFHKFLLEKDEQLVYSLLDFCPKGIGVLAEETGMSPEVLMNVLERLIRRDFVCESLPNYYVRHI